MIEIILNVVSIILDVLCLGKDFKIDDKISNSMTSVFPSYTHRGLPHHNANGIMISKFICILMASVLFFVFYLIMCHTILIDDVFLQHMLRDSTFIMWLFNAVGIIGYKGDD